ncbi:LON peptidase substrate-binding domain-containing protein [Saccharothrix obliqua]|uniref:LON peptidase substrate-binding domain-containing protein n=1 Tax=Saccharothrix obliqua TaxID=2861747 RepID=UPI001C5E1A85|nr:LON peptidase substrate-binding domain-containing protein [Saccharothrix obliqua]MBW4720076.1 LON peptidase substrate-binding domain-containing protein [Saccharothrix obliqua]
MTTTLPLFPLGTVLLPGTSLPLHVFEPRYRQLTVDLVTGKLPERNFGVLAIRQGWEVGPGNATALHDVGCEALLNDAKPLPDGRFDLATTGGRRFRLVELDTESAPYLVGRVEWLEDTPTPAELTELTPLLEEGAVAAFRRYRAAAFEDNPTVAVNEALSYALANDCLLTPDDRQHLLEERSEVRRLRMVRKMMHREAGIIAALHAVPAPIAELGHLPHRN